MRQPVLRCLPGSPDDSQLFYLPDEIIERIICAISPTEVVAFNWLRVNSGFAGIVKEHLRKCTSIDLCEDFLWRFLESHLLSGSPLTRSHQNLLRIVSARYFCHVKELEIPVALFNQLHLILEKDGNTQIAMPVLERIAIHVGEGWGKLVIVHTFDNWKVCKTLCNRLSEIDLVLKLSDSEMVTPCAFRSLVRYLMEAADSETIWNLTLEDYTSRGQGYHGPADFSRYRNQVFISYVRAVLDLGVSLNRLTLLDKRKISPYMMVMCMNKRRSIYMFPEFKRCQELFVCYDIGLIAPIFAHENDRFTSLRVLEVDESHVLYKRDLLEYLSNAPNLSEMRVVVPATWSRRVSTCTRGCFKNQDFACFRPDGWCAVQTRLPTTRFAIVGSNFEMSSSANVDSLKSRTITI